MICSRFCPFVRGCDSCEYRAGTVAAQADSRRGLVADQAPLAYNGSEHGTAPAETRQRLDRGLTLTRLPTRPGGFSG